MCALFVSQYKAAGTKSCRLAAAKLLDEFGANGQNQPDHIRRLFIPRPGYKMVQCDLEGAEAVAVALLCGEGNFRELVRLKIKTHNFVCIKLFPDKFSSFFSSPDEVEALTPTLLHGHVRFKDIIKLCKALKEEYDLAKRVVHGSNYGMGWKTFQETVLKETGGKTVLSAAECKRLLESFFRLFPEIRIFQLLAEAAVHDHRPIANLYGHEITFVSRFTTSLARTGISWAPQSTVGICAILAALELQRQIEANHPHWNLLTITHDSNLAECPEDEAPALATTMSAAMTCEFTSPIDGWKCKIGVEKQVGRNWGKWHETENPDGLKVIE